MTAIIRNFNHFLKIKQYKRLYFTYSKELSMPLNKKPEYVTASDALGKTLNSGDTVFVQGAAATPILLVQTMAKVGKEKNLKNIKVCHMHTEGPAIYDEKGTEEIFTTYCFFMAANDRKAVAEGYGDSIPLFLSEIPLMFYHNIFKPNISLIHVTPPDCHGYCSLGTSVDCVRAALFHSNTIIAQMNPKMPRTFGDATIHESHIDYAIENDCPIVEHAAKGLSETEKQIGKLIAENLVEDGATLQMGIGNIPDAVLSELKNHKDLGLHTEMFSDGIIDLIEKGVITNHKKRIHQGKIIASFFIGSRRLYDFFDNNPYLEMHVVDYVNNVRVISKNPKMTAINACISIDLSGQVNADSIGTRMYSGFGGQLDFIRGSSICTDGKGKPIITLQSVTKKGKSKIVPFLKQGAGVVTSRAHVHYVVTEYGIADLFGKSLRQRAYALINIAHPDHRESLMKAACDLYKVVPVPS